AVAFHDCHSGAPHFSVRDHSGHRGAIGSDRATSPFYQTSRCSVFFAWRMTSAAALTLAVNCAPHDWHSTLAALSATVMIFRSAALHRMQSAPMSAPLLLRLGDGSMPPSILTEESVLELMQTALARGTPISERDLSPEWPDS